MTENTQDEEYQNPPVKSVSCEIRFPTLLSIKDKIVIIQGKVRDKLSGYYTQSVPIAYKGGIIEETWWIFKSNDDTLNLKIKDNSIALISTNYTHFTLFFDIIKESFDFFFKENKIEQFLRIGLRYTNREELKVTESGLSTLLKYFKLKYFKFRKEDPIENFSIRYTTKEGDYYMITLEDYTKSQGKYIYQFDFDSYIENNTNINNYVSIIKNLHDNIMKTFKGYITTDYENDVLKVKK